MISSRANFQKIDLLKFTSTKNEKKKPFLVFNFLSNKSHLLNYYYFVVIMGPYLDICSSSIKYHKGSISTQVIVIII